MSEKEQKLISFILPTYNVEKYIGACLASLVAQSLERTEYEIIIVNDGSTDGSAEVAERFIKEHPDVDIELLTKENGGVSSARNLGLSHAVGNYVWFVDPDDFIRPDCMKKIKPYLKENERNIFYLDARTVPEESKWNEADTKQEISIDKNALSDFEHCGPWTRIVSRFFLEETGITFCERLAYGEDFLWNHLISQNKDKFDHEYYINGYVYFYRLRENSAYRSAKEERNSSNKYYKNLLMLAEEYEKLMQIPEYNGAYLRTTLNQAKQAAILALAFLDRSYFNQELSRLKAEGFYPYGFVWKNLKPEGSIKHTVINWVMFLLPVGWYAKLLNRMVGKR